MEQPEYILPEGTKIRTHGLLGSTKGMVIAPTYIVRRKASARGVITSPVMGHGGDVYWVNHGSSDEPDMAPYCFTEFELDT